MAKTVISNDVMRAKLCNVVAEILGGWFPQFKFEIINHHFLWFSITGKYGANLSPLRELGIEPKTEKAWTRDCTTWEFWLDENIFNNIKKRYNESKEDNTATA